MLKITTFSTQRENLWSESSKGIFFLSVGRHCFGPFDHNGALTQYTYEERLIGDNLSQKKGLLDENDVQHKKTEVHLRTPLYNILGSHRPRLVYDQFRQWTFAWDSLSDPGDGYVIWSPDVKVKTYDLACEALFHFTGGSVTSYTCNYTPGDWFEPWSCDVYKTTYTPVFHGLAPLREGQDEKWWDYCYHWELDVQILDKRSREQNLIGLKDLLSALGDFQTTQREALGIFQSIFGTDTGSWKHQPTHVISGRGRYLFSDTVQFRSQHPKEDVRKCHSISRDPLVETGLEKIETKTHSEIALRAVKDLDANGVNMIAFVRDLKDIKSLIPKLKNLKKLSTHASNYLAYNYGILPTVSDLQNIFAAFRKVTQYDSNGYRIVSSGDNAETSFLGRHYSKTLRAKLAVSNFDTGLQDLESKMRSWGFYPSPKNIWDLVPYSFVLDWFIDIGGLLDKIDTVGRLARLPIEYATLSIKCRCDIYDDLLLKELDCEILEASQTHYSRWVQRSIDSPPINWENEIRVQDHILESTALILQRTKY